MHASIVWIGFLALTSQVLLLREFAVVFHGSELYLSAMLAAWLLPVALGGAAAGRVCDRLRRPRAAFLLLLPAAGVLLPAQVLLVRAAPVLLLERTGAVVSFGRMFLTTLLLCAPLCLLLGALFALACRTAGRREEEPHRRIGRAYVLDAAGTVAGGLIFTFILAPFMRPLHAALGLGLATVMLAAAVWWRLFPGRRLVVLPMALIAAALAAGLVSPHGRRLVFASRGFRFRDYRLVDTRDSIYGRVDVTARGGQIAFFENGGLVATSESGGESEAIAHLPLLYHPRPRSVAVIGGALGGVVRHALAHDPERLDYIELDPTLIACAREYAGDATGLNDPRVRVHDRIDGRVFLQRPPRRYDAVIVCQPDPTTAAVNRFYTLEFFARARDALAPGGIFALRLSGAPGRLSEEQRLLTGSILRTLRLAFGSVLLVPTDGDNVLMATETAALSPDPEILVRRLRERGIRPLRLYPEALRDFHETFRRRYVLGQIASVGAAGVNRDRHPISYYYGMLLSRRIRSGTPGLLAAAERVPLWWLGAAAFAGAGGILAFGRLRRNVRSAAVPAVLVYVGFAGITLEITILLIFQGIYGYVYACFGLMFAAFMLGLVIGGRLGIHLARARVRPLRGLLVCVGLLAAYAILLPRLFDLAAGAGPSLRPILAMAGFPGLTLLVGLAVGFVFPVVTRALGPRAGSAGRAGGMLYALDLAGSFVGALTAGVLLTPVLGLAATCYGVALVLLAALVLLIAAA